MPKPLAPVPVQSTVQPAISASPADQPAQTSATATAKVDQFEDSPGTSGPLNPDIAILADNVVKRFSLEIEEKKRVRLIADAVVSCIAPFLSPKGTLEDQVGLIMLKLLGKIESERRDHQVDLNNAERLQKAIKAEQDKLSQKQKQRLTQSLGHLQKTTEKLQSAHQAAGDDENRVFQGFSSIFANRHQTIMASLREMRGL